MRVREVMEKQAEVDAVATAALDGLVNSQPALALVLGAILAELALVKLMIAQASQGSAH